MDVCRKDVELRTLGKRVMRDKFHWIIDQKIRVGFVYSDSEKKSGGRLTFGECRLVPGTYKPWVPYDFVIVFYEPNVMLMDEIQKERLMEHELRHIGLSDTGALRIEPHDIEDFRPMIDEYGLDWAAVIPLKEE
jgi:hypothetical protein